MNEMTTRSSPKTAPTNASIAGEDACTAPAWKILDADYLAAPYGFILSLSNRCFIIWFGGVSGRL